MAMAIQTVVISSLILCLLFSYAFSQGLLVIKLLLGGCELYICVPIPGLVL